jgi:catechol 2,3-dioxygenase
MASYGSQATFLSVGGYHHHLGANTWASAGAPPPTEGSASLRLASVVLPDSASRGEVVSRVAATGQDPEETPEGPVVRDPAGNRLLLA